MKDIIDQVSLRAIEQYGDSFTQEYYRRLKERSFCTTRCQECGEMWYPPKPFCPKCYCEKVSWVELSGRGKLYAFTQQERSFRFSKPDVIGLVELNEGIGRILTRIDARYEELEIGMGMKVSFIDVSEELTLHQFVPVK